MTYKELLQLPMAHDVVKASSSKIPYLAMLNFWTSAYILDDIWHTFLKKTNQFLPPPGGLPTFVWGLMKIAVELCPVGHKQTNN